MPADAYKSLYRAIGLPEWRLTVAAGRKSFVPETLRGNFYYPTLTFPGACATARDILALSASCEYSGLVVAFDVPPDSLRHYAEILENIEKNSPKSASLWVDEQTFRALNQRISGVLRVVEVYYGSARREPGYTPQELNESGFLG